MKLNLDDDLKVLEISVRLQNALEKANVKTIREFIAHTEKSIVCLQNVGPTTKNEFLRVKGEVLITLKDQGVTIPITRPIFEKTSLFEKEGKFKLCEEGIVLFWQDWKSEYFIEWERLVDLESVLRWVTHLSEKFWVRMTPQTIHWFILAVCKKKGWNLFEKGL